MTLIDIVKGLGLLTLLALGFVYLRVYAESYLDSRVRNAILGLMFGLIIAAVMLDPIRLTEGATFDPRGGPAILAGVFGGPIAALIAAIVGSLVRWYVIGGPVAAGGVAGFVLYGAFGAIAGIVISRYQIKIGNLTLLALGALGTLAVLPAFFVSVDAATGLSIIQKAGPVLVINNLLGTLVVGLFISRARDWSDVRIRLELEQFENARLALIARGTTTGVIITDRDGYTEWVNNAFLTMSGYTAAEILGQKPGDLLQGADTDPKTVAVMSGAVKKGEAFEVDIINYHKSGAPYWVQIHCEPFIDPDGSEKFMAIESDITARKDVEGMKSQFVSLVNHELRTPLTSIIGSIGLVRSGALGTLPDKAVELVEIAHSNSDRLLEIINDILDFEKLQSGGMEFKFEHVDLGTLADRAITLNTSFANQFAVSLTRSDALSGIFVHGDDGRLLQVMTNLISNASKFSPPNDTVTISLQVRDGRARVEVADHGPGIPEQFRLQMFDRFTQADARDDRPQGGTGLGLSISKGIIDAHGGEIGFAANDPTGSVFFVELPLMTEHELPAS